MRAYAQKSGPKQENQRGITVKAGRTIPGQSPAVKSLLVHEFSRIPIFPEVESKAIAAERQNLAATRDKSVDGQNDHPAGPVEDKDPDAGTAPKDAGTPDAPAPSKKAGVESFEVKWKENALNSPTTAKLRLNYSARFKKDATHDPALAEFRQNAFHRFKVTAGPHKGQKDNNPPIHDDNYSRADDKGGNAIDDVDFVSNDNPGPAVDALDKDDVIDYSFTAEQMIIDTSDSNKVIEKRGPHTATIKGKDPRSFDGVPKTLN
jgi:hypothetical protein